MHVREHPFDDLRKIVGNILLFIFKLDLTIILMFYTYTMLVIPLLLLTIIGIADTLWLMAMYGVMVGLILLAWRNASNRCGILFASMPLVYQWWLTNVFFILGHVYEIIPRAGIYGWFAIVC